MTKIHQLYRLFLKSTGICTDTRKLKEGNIFFALKGDHFNGNKFAEDALKKGALYAVVDDIALTESPRCIFVNNVLETLQQLATFHRRKLNLPIIAITGSNGKTTTKELVYTVLSEKYNTKATYGNLNNHIGVPLTLLSFTTETEIGIVEMGANHQQEIQKLCTIAQPDYGYITNFGKAHLEGFGGFEGVVKGKSELYDYLFEHKKLAFVNANDKLQLKQSINNKQFCFGEENTNANCKVNFIEATPYVALNYEGFTIQSQLIGRYNAENITAAIGVGHYFNLKAEVIKRAVENYIPKNNRSQIIQKNSNQIILDAYNANPTSMQVALENFKNFPGTNKIVILGDMFEVGDSSAEEHQKIVDGLEKSAYTAVYACGTNFYHTQTSTVKTYESCEVLMKALKGQHYKNSTILIKGSRGMALERILEVL